MKKYNPGIYEIINIISGKRYVGSSAYLGERISEHARLLNNGKHSNKYLQNAYSKYGGKNFRFKILLYCSKENLIFYEQRAIDAYGIKNLYNIRIKAESNQGLKASWETRKKLSKIRKGRKLKLETRLKISLAHKGKKLSQKTKNKLSKINKGKNHPKYGIPHSEETKKKIGDSHRGEKCYLYGKRYWENPYSIPVLQICCYTNKTIKIWSSATEASHVLNINRSHITAVCKKKRTKTGGYKWNYA
jgi:group I intron endonuclease